MDIEAVRAEIASLEAASERIRRAGPFLQGVRLERSPGGGTASKGSKSVCKYARLRSGKGKPIFDGKKSKYIALSEASRYEAEIARGKQLSQVEAKIARLQKLLD